jgi:hypothetical protein
MKIIQKQSMIWVIPAAIECFSIVLGKVGPIDTQGGNGGVVQMPLSQQQLGLCTKCTNWKVLVTCSNATT